MNEHESYSIHINGFDGVERMVNMPRPRPPIEPVPEREPASFYIADYRQPPGAEQQTGVSVYGIHHGDCNWLVKGNGPNPNPDDLSTNPKLREYASDIRDVSVGPGQELPAFFYYRDELPKFNSFTLQGRHQGICGLDAIFEFKKVQDGRFSKYAYQTTACTYLLGLFN